MPRKDETAIDNLSHVTCHVRLQHTHIPFLGDHSSNIYNIQLLQRWPFLRYNYKSTTLHVQSTRIISSRHRWTSGSSFSKGVPVEVVLSSFRAKPLQIGDVVTQFLDGRHLLMEELALDEIRHLWQEAANKPVAPHNLPNRYSRGNRRGCRRSCADRAGPG